MSHRPVALITGASAGIGEALARQFAQAGYDLVLAARRKGRLESLAKALAELTNDACVAYPVPVNLARSKGPAELVRAIDDLGLEVDVLVNNAGVAESGRFISAARKPVNDLVNLNVRALTELSLIFGQRMAGRGAGRILNVASIVAFQPVPSMAVYAASKAYVLSLTESLAEELRGSGVTCTALCPGLTKTEMVDDLVPSEFEPLSSLAMADVDSVARAGLRACLRGETITIPGMLNQAFVNWTQFQPRWSYRLWSGMFARMSFASEQRR